MSTADAAPRGIHLKAKSQSRCRWHGLGLIVLAFVALTTAWDLLIPPYENLDELEHAEVVRHIAVTGRLPVHDQAEAQGFHVRQEASQPPLYHILAAGWSRLLSLPTTPHNPSLVPGDVVACGPAATFYNKATWKHEPFARDAMWRGASLTLHGQRAFSTLLQVITLIGVWTLARRISTDGTVAELATILVAFNPQFQLVAAGVNNDNAVIPLATWGLVVGFDLWDRGPTWRRSLLFGVLSGLAALSKLSGLGLVGVGGLALLVRIIERRTTFRDAVAHGLMIVLPAALLVSPWLLRNIRLYGDPTALAPMLAKVGTVQLLPPRPLLALSAPDGCRPDRPRHRPAAYAAPAPRYDGPLRHLVHCHCRGLDALGYDDRGHRRATPLPCHCRYGHTARCRLERDQPPPGPHLGSTPARLGTHRPGRGAYDDAGAAGADTGDHDPSEPDVGFLCR